GKPFAEFWRSNWEIRKFSWDNFRETCEGCVVNDPRYFCTARCPAQSYARNNRYIGCGASDFEKLSLITRTAMLEQTETGALDRAPVQSAAQESSQAKARVTRELPVLG